MKRSDIKSKKEFAKGKRGLILVGKYKNKKIAIKKQRKDITVTESINNEFKKLKVLNEKNIGPKLRGNGKNYIIYEFIEGIFIPEFFETENKTNIKKVIKNVLTQCFTLDSMNLNKEEMTNPYKHILISKNKKTKELKVTLIDFERCKHSIKPKNVTQFLQYLMSSKISQLLKIKGFEFNKKKLIPLAKEYKEDISLKKFKNLMKKLLK